jgi:hypothetical protein
MKAPFRTVTEDLVGSNLARCCRSEHLVCGLIEEAQEALFVHDLALAELTGGRPSSRTGEAAVENQEQVVAPRWANFSAYGATEQCGDVTHWQVRSR